MKGRQKKNLPLCNKLHISPRCKTPVVSVELRQGWIWSRVFALKSLSAPKQWVVPEEVITALMFIMGEGWYLAV